MQKMRECVLHPKNGTPEEKHNFNTNTNYTTAMTANATLGKVNTEK